LSTFQETTKGQSFDKAVYLQIYLLMMDDVMMLDAPLGTGSRLTLNEVSTGNDGKYSCWAQNFAERTKQIELEVQCK